MDAFRIVKPQNASQIFQKWRRHLDVASLLEPRVPREPDATEHGHLLTSKAACASAIAHREAYAFWREACSPRPEKLGKF
jgi:hypothetical protein